MIDAKEMMETCSSCAGTGIAGHPDSGWVCFDCNGDGAVAPNAAPALAARVVQLEAENAILKTEKHADAEAIGALEEVVKAADDMVRSFSGGSSYLNSLEAALAFYAARAKLEGKA